MTIKALKEALAELPDSAEIDIVYEGKALLLDSIEPSDWNNTMVFHAVEPD